jgi:hypothetical protein
MDIFDSGILSDSCQTHCNCKQMYETEDSFGMKDINGGAPK